MLRKMLSTVVVFLLFGAAGQVFADAAAELEHAESYHRVWNYEPAEAGYKAVIEKYPGTNYALDAYKKLVHLYIEWGKDQQADAALQQMLTDFADRLHDVMAAVLYIAEESVWSGKYEKGRELFQYILDNHSQSEYAFSAQVSLVISNIWLGQVEVADAAFEQLMTQYSEKENIAEAVRNIAQEYLEKDKFEKSFGLYQYIVDNHPQSEHAMWAQVGVVMSNIGLGDEDAINAATDKLIAEFYEDPQIPEAIYMIAIECVWSKKFEKAQELFQHILDTWSQSKYAIKSRAGIAASNVNLGRLEEPYAIVDELLADFPGHPELPQAIFLIAEQYYNKAVGEGNKDADSKVQDNLQKATTVCERIINRFPASDSAPEIYDMAADCYRQLDQYGKAIECYREVVSNWPNYSKAWNAQFQIGYCSQQMKNTGVVSRSLADAVTKAAYERVLEKYPDCPAANAARNWLKYHSK